MRPGTRGGLSGRPPAEAITPTHASAVTARTAAEAIASRVMSISLIMACVNAATAAEVGPPLIAAPAARTHEAGIAAVADSHAEAITMVRAMGATPRRVRRSRSRFQALARR